MGLSRSPRGFVRADRSIVSLFLRGVLAALVVASAAGAAFAQNKEYRYETDPVRLGLNSVWEGDLIKAKAYFDEAIANNYRVDEAHRGLGEILLQQGRYADSEKEFRTALAGGKQVPEANAGLGILFLRQGRAADAEAAFQAALSQDKKLWRAQYGLARLAIQKGDVDGAEDLVDSGKKKKGIEEGEQLYRHGMALLLLAKGKPDDAETEIILAMNLAPSDPDIVATVGDVYEKKGVAERAISAYEQTLNDTRIASNKGQIHYRVGLLYEKQQKYQNAIDNYQAAIKADSTLADAYLHAGALFNSAKQYPFAMQLYDAYTRYAPNDADGYRRLAEACIESRDPRFAPNAFEAASKAVQIDSTSVENRRALARAAAAVRKTEIGLEVYRSIPDSLFEARDYMNLGLIYLGTNEEEDRDAARTNLETAVSLDSTLADAYLGLGRLDIQNEDYESAEENLFRATSLGPSTPGFAYLNLGVAQLQIGAAPGADDKTKRTKYEQALQSFQKSAAADQKSAQAQVYIGQTYALMNLTDAAEGAYNKALAIDPASGGALKGLGFVLIGKQRYVDAEKYLVKATETTMASDAGTWVLLGQARAYQAKVSPAQAAFQRALALDPTNKQAKEGLKAIEGATGGGAGSR